MAAHWSGLADIVRKHKDTVDVLGAHARVTLLVVPPQTPPQAAHEALMAAGHRGNTDAIAELLTAATLATPTAGSPGGQAEAADQPLELDGGRVYEGV